MELPAQLRQAVDSALSGASVSDLAAAAKALSQRYRDEVRVFPTEMASRADMGL